MVTIIRIIWFFISMIVFTPAIRAIESFLLKMIVGLIIFVFLYLIPSNACISMYRKNSRKEPEHAANLIWTEVKRHVDYSQKHFNYFTLTYYWSAFYYALLPVLKNRKIDVQLRNDFITKASQLAAISEDKPLYFIRDFIEHAFDEAMVAYIQDVGNPHSQGAPESLYYVMSKLCDPDEEYDNAKFQAFTSSCIRLFDAFLK